MTGGGTEDRSVFGGGTCEARIRHVNELSARGPRRYVAALGYDAPRVPGSVATSAAGDPAAGEGDVVPVLLVEAEEWIMVLVLGPLSVELSLGGTVVGLSPVGVKDGSEGRVGVVRYLGEPLAVAQVRHNCKKCTLPKKIAER